MVIKIKGAEKSVDVVSSSGVFFFSSKNDSTDK
jgi:hypothetical protein